MLIIETNKLDRSRNLANRRRDHPRPNGKSTSAQLKAWRCWWEDGRYGDLFYLLPPGTIFAPSFMNQKRVPGMHGYTPAHEDSTACWLSNDADANPEGLADIYAVMTSAADRRD